MNPEKELILEGLEFFESSENPDLINPEEIKNLMDKLELKDKMYFIYDLISELCSNNNKGLITKTDFINFLENKLNDTQTKEGIHTIYNVFTDSKDDVLPLTNFCKVAREIGDVEKDEELKNLLKDAEMTGKEINFDEFNEIMNKNEKHIKQNKEDKKSPKQKINKFARKKIWKREEKDESELSEEKSSQRNSHNNQRYENINSINNNTNEETEPKNVYSYKRVKVEQTKKTLSPKNDEQKEEPITENMVTVEEIITEKKVEAPNNNMRSKYKFRNRFRNLKQGDENKDLENNEENNNNDNNEAKRYHRRYRPNYNNNNIEIKNDNINNNITYNRYRRKADN
jgi:Ca2+-binding EF-hand superfamily protein